MTEPRVIAAEEPKGLTFPTYRMLIDRQCAEEEMALANERLIAASAGAPLGEVLGLDPYTGKPFANGGFGRQQRTMNFAHIKLEGVMYSRDTWYRASVSRVVAALREAYEDPDIDGVLLEVNTGGGEVTAGQMMASAIKDRPKPVVAFAHYAASGGIMATMHADEVVASGTTARFGSIGVYTTIDKWLIDYYSRYYKEVYSDLSPDKNEAYREFQTKGTVDKFKEELNEIARAFQAEVVAARNLPKATRENTLRGGTWLAEESKRRGLIDSIGSFQYALTRLADIAAFTNNSN
ncbi:MAG: S49 family peptidase [Bacteroidota bacterium]